MNITIIEPVYTRHAFESKCSRFGVDGTLFMRKFSYNGRKYRLVGFGNQAEVFPCVALRVGDHLPARFTVRTVVSLTSKSAEV